MIVERVLLASRNYDSGAATRGAGGKDAIIPWSAHHCSSDFVLCDQPVCDSIPFQNASRGRALKVHTAVKQLCQRTALPNTHAYFWKHSFVLGLLSIQDIHQVTLS